MHNVVSLFPFCLELNLPIKKQSSVYSLIKHNNNHHLGNKKTPQIEKQQLKAGVLKFVDHPTHGLSETALRSSRCALLQYAPNWGGWWWLKNPLTRPWGLPLKVPPMIPGFILTKKLMSYNFVRLPRLCWKVNNSKHQLLMHGISQCLHHTLLHSCKCYGLKGAKYWNLGIAPLSPTRIAKKHKIYSTSMSVRNHSGFNSADLFVPTLSAFLGVFSSHFQEEILDFSQHLGLPPLAS